MVNSHYNKHSSCFWRKCSHFPQSEILVLGRHSIYMSQLSALECWNVKNPLMRSTGDKMGKQHRSVGPTLKEQRITGMCLLGLPCFISYRSPSIIDMSMCFWQSTILLFQRCRRILVKVMPPPANHGSSRLNCSFVAGIVFLFVVSSTQVVKWLLGACTFRVTWGATKLAGIWFDSVILILTVRYRGNPAIDWHDDRTRGREVVIYWPMTGWYLVNDPW